MKMKRPIRLSFIMLILALEIMSHLGWAQESTPNSSPFSLTIKEKEYLLTLARTTIKEFLESQTVKNPDKEFLDQHPVFRIPRGVFVTLKKGEKLRGCIGELFPQRPLYEGVQNCAIKSATQDNRFPPVTCEELEDLTLSISILSFPTRIKTENASSLLTALTPGKDGVILIYNGRQSTFLPKVWEDIPKPDDFLSHLCQKQGSPADCWQKKETVSYRYGTYDFSE